MIFQKSLPFETGHGPLSSASASPMEKKKRMRHPPHEKRMCTKYTKKLAAFRALVDCHGPYRGI
jgi:hypothetical protein